MREKCEECGAPADMVRLSQRGPHALCDTCMERAIESKPTFEIHVEDCGAGDWRARAMIGHHGYSAGGYTWQEAVRRLVGDIEAGRWSCDYRVAFRDRPPDVLERLLEQDAQRRVKEKAEWPNPQ